MGLNSFPMLNFKDASFWIWVGVLLVAIFAGTTGDISQFKPMQWPYMDKAAHAIYLGALATLLSQKWRGWPVLAGCALVAVLIEVVQYWIPGRSSNVDDALWGIGGAALAWGLYQIKGYRKLLQTKIF